MSGPVGIVAGNGDLPLELARELTTAGRDIFIVAIDDEASSDVEAFPHEYFKWGQVGRLFKTLSRENVEQIVLAGGVVGRPEISVANIDFGAVLTLPKVLSTMLSGDNEILESVVRLFEKKGFAVLGIAELLPDIVAKAGSNGTSKARKAELKSMAEGVAVVRTLAPHDVGQGCVVIGKRAVAIEGAEGTDAMLQRVAHLRSTGRLPDRRDGVLVKALKTGQNEKADLPTIGPQTVEYAIAANLKGIAIEAGRTIIINRNLVMQMAKDSGLFIHGFEN